MGLTNGIAMVTAAQNALAIAKNKLAPIAMFSYDASPDMTEGNVTVQVPLFDVGAVDTTVNSYETDASPTITAREVTLDKYQANDFPLTGFNQYKLQKVSVLQAILENQFSIVCDAVVADVLSIVTNANYSTAAFTGAAADFDTDAITDLRTACKAFPSNRRALVLPSEYTAGVMKDTKYQGQESQLGLLDPFLTGKLPNIRGFAIAECDVVPTNSENLVGFACHPSAMAVAMRPGTQSLTNEAPGSEYMIVTDPESGISLGVYIHVNPTTRIQWITTEIKYGYVKGNTSLLKRIVSA